MAYIPTAKDFEGVSGGYMPTAADFADATPSNVAPGLLDRLRAATQSALLSAATEVAKSSTASKVLQGAGNKVEPFNRTVENLQLPTIAQGMLQGAGSTAASVANLPIEAANLAGANLPNFQMPDLSQYGLPNQSALASLAGNVIGGSFIPLGAYGRIKSAIPEMKGLLKYVPSMAAGAGSGFLTGENLPGGRIGSAIVGGGTSPLIEGLPATISSFKKAGSLEDDIKNSRQQLENITGSNSELQAKTDLVKVLKSAKEATNKDFDKRYDDFYHGDVGSRLIQNPFTAEEIAKFGMGHLSDETRGMLPSIAGRLGRKVESKSGKSYSTVGAKQANPTIGDYIKLTKQLRDEESDIRGQISAGVPEYQREALMAKAGKIGNLKDAVKAKAFDAMNEDEIKSLKNLDNDYRQIALPFKLDPDIRKAVTGDGEITAQSFFNATNQPNRAAWQQYMQKAPWGNEYRRAITNHDLRNLDLRSVGPLTTTSRSDIMNSITPEARNAIAQHADNMQTKADVRDQTAIINNFKKNILPAIAAVFGVREAGKAYHEISGGNE